MKLLIKIFVLLFTAALIGAGFVWFGELDFSPRNSLSGLDALLSTVELKLGSTKNGISGFLAEKAGNCVGLKSTIYGSSESISLESLEIFPFSIPLLLQASAPSLSPVPNLICTSGDGRVLNVQAMLNNVVTIDRAFGAPFKLSVYRQQPLRIFGENLLFLLNSSLGTIEIRSEGVASLLFAMLPNTNTDIKNYIITVEKGTVRAEIVRQMKGPNSSESIIEFVAIGSGRLFWKDGQVPVTQKAPAILLPSGLSFK